MNAKRRPGPVRQLSLRSASPQRYPLRKQLSTDSAFASDSWTNCNPTPKIKSAPRLAWVERENNVEIVATKCVESNATKYKKMLARQNSVEKETLLYTRQELAERLRKAWKERERNKPGLDIFLAQNTNTDPSKNVLVDLIDDVNDENDLLKTNCDKTTKHDSVKVGTRVYSEKNTSRQSDNVRFVNGKSEKSAESDPDSERKNERKMCVKSNCDDKEKTAYVPSTNAAKCRERGLTQISIVLSSLTRSSDNENSFDEVDTQSETCEESVDPSNGNATVEQSKRFDNKNDAINRTNIFDDHSQAHDTQTVRTETNTIAAKDDSVQDNSIKNDSQGCNNVVMVPLSATAKREIFQKQSNKLFTRSASNINVKPRPPLVRTLSVQSTDNKPKFMATKRRIKTAPIKRKVYQSSGSGGGGGGGEDEIGSEKTKGRVKKSLTRCRSLEGSEIVTLVSLTSPAESDIEDDVPAKNVTSAGKSTHGSPAKHVGQNGAKKNNIQPKIIDLRKNIKSVSFQHSALTAVRNYSANFPLRRGSVNIANSHINDNIVTQTATEKRTSVVQTPTTEMKSTKRRLIRMNSAPTSCSEDPIPENDKYCEKTSNSTSSLKCKEKNSSSTLLNDQNETEDNCHKDDSINTEVQLKSDDGDTKEPDCSIEDDSSDDEDSQERKLKSTKEKQCWKMYKKMCDKGIAVTFDTILRGMLTPTEYRLRTKEALGTNETATDDDNDKAEDVKQ